MGADNWMVCPKCAEENRIKTLNAQARKRKEFRSKVSELIANEEVEKVVELSKEYEVEQESEAEQTMREDYEIGLDKDGYFSVSYACLCTVCRFTWKYKHGENILKPGALKKLC